MFQSKERMDKTFDPTIYKILYLIFKDKNSLKLKAWKSKMKTQNRLGMAVLLSSKIDLGKKCY